MTSTKFVLTLLVVIALGGASVAGAATVYVDPAGDDANDCLSPATACKTVQAGIDRAADGDAVQLAAGTYAEEVAIHQREDLTLRGGPGVEIVPPSPAAAESRLISVFRSEGLHFEELTLTGNGTADFTGGMSLQHSHAVGIDRCTVQDLGGGGIVLFQNSSVTVQASRILRNRFHGLRIDETSHAVVLGSPLADAPTVVQDNLFAGVILTGSVLFRGSVLLQGNVHGVLGEGAEVFSCCGEAELQIKENLIGMSLRGGHLQLRGPALIEANSLLGVRLNAASGSFGRFSQARVVVRGNGTPGDPTSGGIALTGSHLDLFVADVVANRSRGVLLQDSSSIRLFDTVVADNQAEGLRLEALSTARLFDPSTLEDNGGFDLSCTPDSVASGDDRGVGRKFCPQFDRSPSPGPPREP